MKKKIVAVSTVVAVSAFAVSHLFAQTQEQLEQRAEQMQQQKYEVMEANTQIFQGSVTAIDKYVADDAVFTSPAGVWAFNKTDLLKRAKSGKWPQPARLNVIQVTPQEDTAVALERCRMKIRGQSPHKARALNAVG